MSTSPITTSNLTSTIPPSSTGGSGGVDFNSLLSMLTPGKAGATTDTTGLTSTTPPITDALSTQSKNGPSGSDDASLFSQLVQDVTGGKISFTQAMMVIDHAGKGGTLDRTAMKYIMKGAEHGHAKSGAASPGVTPEQTDLLNKIATYIQSGQVTLDDVFGIVEDAKTGAASFDMSKLSQELDGLNIANTQDGGNTSTNDTTTTKTTDNTSTDTTNTTKTTDNTSTKDTTSPGYDDSLLSQILAAIPKLRDGSEKLPDFLALLQQFESSAKSTSSPSLTTDKSLSSSDLSSMLSGLGSGLGSGTTVKA